MEELALLDYVGIIRRHIKIFVCIALAFFGLTVLFALTWSNYRSDALVEIEPAEISESVTSSNGSASAFEREQAIANQRISRLKQKVLSTSELVDIITKYNLFESARRYTPISAVAEKMRKKIAVEVVADTLSVQKNNNTPMIAIKISFTYLSPLLAQQVTNELVSRFLDVDLQDRRIEAEETTSFIDKQITALEEAMKEQEKKIAEFRATHGDVRPEALAFNQQAVATIMMNLQSIDGQIRVNEGLLGTLRAQIATTDPYSRVSSDGQILSTPSIQLKALQGNLAALSAQYGEDHPDVIKTKRQIESLKAQTGLTDSSDTALLNSKIINLKTELATKLKSYGEDNPDVVSLKRQINKLESSLNATTTTKRGNIKIDADNPAYLQISAQLKAAEAQQQALIEQKTELLAQQLKYQKAVIANPVAEQKMADISRDYENAQMRYRELKEKKMSADIKQQVESDRKGQRLTVINPPELPLTTKPARSLIILGGFIFSLMLGAASVFVWAMMSSTILSPNHLSALVGTAPLVVVPHISTRAETMDITKKKTYLVIGGVVLFILAIALFSIIVMPLDVLFAVVSQRLGQ